MNKTTLQFGGKDFELKSPRMRDSRVWREKLVTFLTEFPAAVGVGDPKDFGKILLTNPDPFLEIIATYPGLDVSKEHLLEAATEEELVTAYLEILLCALRPFLEFRGTAKSLAENLGFQFAL
jgi:hypothetical protein